jgi:hypothetical protein
LKGDWSGCATAGTGSRKDNLYLTKYNDTTVIFLATETSFASSGCTGTATRTYSTGHAVFNGSKTIAGSTVDKAVVSTDDGGAEKQVFLVQGTDPVTLTLGRTGADVDADGYPTTLKGSSLIKQGAALEKYLGTWRSCVASGNGSSEQVLTLKKVSDTSAEFSWARTGYPSSTTCSGNSLGTSTEGYFLLQGTRKLGADTVDAFEVSENLKPVQKQVFLMKGTGPVTITPGRADGPRDADGYPTTLESISLTRQ